MSYAPVQQPPQTPADIDDAVLDAPLDHAPSEFGSDELGWLSSSVEVKRPTKPSRSTSTDATQEALSRDSDAVQSVFYAEQRMIGALLSSADGGSSALCYVLQALCVGSAVYFLLTDAQAFADMAGMAEPNALLYVFPVPNSLAYVFLVLVIDSARDALRSGGALEQLKVGEIMISEKDSATLSRWRMGLGVLSALLVLLGLLALAAGILKLPPFGNPDMPAQARINWALGGLLWCTVIPLACSGWLHSMYTASCLCRDDVIEVIKNVRAVDPTSDEWEGAVAQPALGLIEKMQLLSDGWSGGLAGWGGFFWFFALCFFTLTINVPYYDGVDATAGNPPGTTRTISLVVTAIFSMLPFLLAYDIAATSTWCDNLMEELNDARTNHGRESHLTIQWLETALKQLNAGQGLGFKVPWLGVIDKKSMASYAAKLYTVLAAILTSLLALQAEGHAAASTAGDSECALSSAQAASIRALMADSNASCVYNMTVQSVRGSV